MANYVNTSSVYIMVELVQPLYFHCNHLGVGGHDITIDQSVTREVMQ